MFDRFDVCSTGKLFCTTTISIIDKWSSRIRMAVRLFVGKRIMILEFYLSVIRHKVHCWYCSAEIGLHTHTAPIECNDERSCVAPRNSGAASDYLIFMLDINVMAFMTISTRRFVVTISLLRMLLPITWYYPLGLLRNPRKEREESSSRLDTP